MLVPVSARRLACSLAVLGSVLALSSALDAQGVNAPLPQQLPVPLREGDAAAFTGVLNGGPGIGNLAFDPKSGEFAAGGIGTSNRRH